MAGFPLARGLQVVWIVPRVRGLNGFAAVQQFSTAEDYRSKFLMRCISGPFQPYNAWLRYRNRFFPSCVSSRIAEILLSRLNGNVGHAANRNFPRRLKRLTYRKAA